MPIFEYLCRPCNRIYSFLSLSPNPSRQPVCPRCGASDLSRTPSTFAVASSRSSETASSVPDGGGQDAGMSAMEREAMGLMEGLDERDAEDPRVMARLMRRMAEMAGEPVTPTMNEMFRRMEAGEDPEALEEELGPQLEEELGEDSGGEDDSGLGGGPPSRDGGLYSL